MGYKLEYSKQAGKDARLLEQSGLDRKAKKLLAIMRHDPYEPPCEKLARDLKGFYSRRINDKHRLVYEVLQGANQVLPRHAEATGRRAGNL